MLQPYTVNPTCQAKVTLAHQPTESARPSGTHLIRGSSGALYGFRVEGWRVLNRFEPGF